MCSVMFVDRMHEQDKKYRWPSKDASFVTQRSTQRGSATGEPLLAFVFAKAMPQFT